MQQPNRMPASLSAADWPVKAIKMAPRHTACCEVATHEVVDGERERVVTAFADYESLEDSCRDYAWLITQGAPYRAAWQAYQANRDLHVLIAAVARTYATDPNYARVAGTIAGQGNVAQSIATARRETAAHA